MKKTLIFVLIAVMVLSICFTLAACGKDNNPQDNLPDAPSTEDPRTNNNNDTPEPVVNNEDFENAHYLVFMESGKTEQDAKEILRLLVVEGDTYEDLEPFFPMVPNKTVSGVEYSGKWKISKDDPVYDQNNKEIKVTASYTAVE